MKLILHFTVFFFGFLLFVGRSSEAAEIINGKEVKPHSMPYMALLQPVICGGILIDPKWVLTAAHCKDYVLEEVFLGVHSIKAEKKEKRQIRKIAGYYPHPAYNKTDRTNDIMLLKLNQPAVKTRTVNFFNLKTAAKEPVGGAKCTAAGWGRTKPKIRIPSDVLMSVTLTVIDRKKCNSSYNSKPIITKDMICAGSTGKTQADTCQGDSGGPLICNKQLIGITSFGRGCGDLKTPGVYTFISAKYISWIQTTMKKSN